MRGKTSAIFKILMVVYAFLVLVVIPLYMRNGLVRIGDAKYYAYRNASLLLAAISAITATVRFLVDENGRKVHLKRQHLSPTDCCVLVFGIISFCSWALSSYKEIAFWGYEDWHMGLVTQLLLVWAYFLVSRWYDGRPWIWLAAAIAAGAVFLVGVLNRFGFDLLGVFRNIDIWDWNRLNLLSTIGNINWYCSYLCTVLPVTIFFFWKGRGIRRILAGGLLEVGIVSFFTQGSDSGYVAMVVILLVLLWHSVENRRSMIAFLQTVLLVPGTCLGLNFLAGVLQVGLIIPEDSISAGMIRWKGWWWVLAALLGAITVLVWRESGSARDLCRETRLAGGIKAAMLAAGIAGVMFLAGCQISDSLWNIVGRRELLRLNDAWGSGRGALWRMSVEGAASGGVKQLLLGAGPDCYAPYIYSHYPVDQMLQISGQWKGAVFANAHNEWLNMLVTQGVLGVFSYAGIFLASFYRCMRSVKGKPFLLIVIMCIAGYAANNFLSFQQIIAAPAIFVIMAAGEGMCRKEAYQNRSPSPVGWAEG